MENAVRMGKRFGQHTWWVAVVITLFMLSGCGRKDVTGQVTRDPQVQKPDTELPIPPLELSADQVVLTVLATNDIHGGVEPYVNSAGEKFGGLARVSGVFRAIKQGLLQRFPGQAGFLMLDGGDQFQGTLLSNFDEGMLTIDAMSAMGYDAAVPGNHAYDFGPLGWLQDKVIEGQGDQDPRSALKRLQAAAKFPYVSSNTFYKDSIRDGIGRPIEVDGDSCRPLNPSGVSTPAEPPRIEWSLARRPEWVQPYVIRDVAGVRVAIIGIDVHETPTVTTPQNVTDLCFASHTETYLRLRAELEGRADAFVALIHDGSGDVQQFVREVVASGLPNRLDAVVAGHTHRPERFIVSGVPIIQSGANAERFARLDLVYDKRAGRVIPAKTRNFGGIPIPFDRCAKEKQAQELCAVDAATGQVLYEGVPLTPDPAVEALIAAARAQIAPVAGRKLGTTTDVIKRDYLKESPLANALNDTLREISGAEITFMNGGGIRADLPKGDIDYERFFRVLPFGNRGVVIAPMTYDQLLGLLTMAAQTCGTRGGLMASGIRVKYEQNCEETPEIKAAQLDPKARILRIEMLSGEVVLDVEKGIQPDPARVFTVATLDFLHSGGSGYKFFIGTPLVRDMGILREVMTEHFVKKPFLFEAKTDGRWQGVKRMPGVTPPVMYPSISSIGEAQLLRQVQAELKAQAAHEDPCGIH